jgi:Protein of unknown function (DUF2599)
VPTATASPSTGSPSTEIPTVNPVSPVPAPPGAAALVATAHWSATSAGFRLHVRPSHYGRAHAAGRPGLALEQALRAAGTRPLAITTGIRQSLTNQLACHAEFATRKPWWDLETWRPDVGLAATVLAACNP